MEGKEKITKNQKEIENGEIKNDIDSQDIINDDIEKELIDGNVDELAVIKEDIINENVKSDKHRKYFVLQESNKKKIKIILIIFIILIVNLAIIFGIICVLNRLNTNVYKNVYIFDKDISNYSSDQISQFLIEKTKIIDDSLDLKIYLEDKEIYSIKSEDIDFNIDMKDTISKVMGFGRENNFFIDNIKILSALINKTEIVPTFSYSEQKLDEVIKNIDLSIDDRYEDDTYIVDEENNKLIINKGKTGNSIDYNEVEENIIELFKKVKSSDYSLNIYIKKPKSIDVLQLYKDTKKEPVDAYIDSSTNPPKFVDEKNGFDLDVDKLKETLNMEENKGEGISIEIPLTILTPKIKLSDITYTLYNDKLSGYTTYFNSAQNARAKNLEIALSHINGTIVMPGKTFSYYETVGEIDASGGYLDAATFKAGKVVYEVGGGVCQTSSTLYNVALLANMEIVERHQHGLPVGYVPPSRDATIYGDILDFKFKNTRNYPIKIVTSYSASGNMNISIYGTKEENEYEIVLSSKVLYYIPFNTSYIYDANIESGVTSVISNGVNGYCSESYITKKLNGTVVSSELISKDVYKAMQASVKVGTKVINKEVNIY